MSTDNITLFTQMIQAQNIACNQLVPDFSNLYKTDSALRCRLYANYDYSNFQNYILKNSREKEILKLKDDFSLVYYIVQVEDMELMGNSPVSEAEQIIYLVIGPTLEIFPSDEEIRKILLNKSLPDHLFRDLQAYYGNLAIPSDRRIFETTLLDVACHLFSQEFKFSSKAEDDPISFERGIGEIQLNKNPSIAIQSIEERYELEDKMMDAIASGDHTSAARNYSMFANFKITPRSENSLLNRKNLSIVFNTLCRKSVQKGHVHPVYIDELSTRFAISVNLARSLKELETIESDMLHKYCLLVRNHSMKNYTKLVQHCITYTDFHYAEPLTLSFFADMCHVTKPYLSGLFKKETDTNLTDYIHTVRIRHSLVLLNSTQLPIHVVAVSCGYSEVNYFIKIFKRLNGITPKQYRAQMNRA